MSDLVTPWTAAYQAPLSVGFSRQEYWSGVPLPSPEAAGGSRQGFLTEKKPVNLPLDFLELSRVCSWEQCYEGLDRSIL